VNPQRNIFNIRQIRSSCGRCASSLCAGSPRADPRRKKSCEEDANALEKAFSVRLRWMLSLTLVVGLLAAACARERPGSAKEIKKIVSLTPSATELVAALGLADRLVGVDDYSTYPPEVSRLPRVGSFLRPNAEAIVRLHPDLVIADDIHTDAAAALRGAGIETVLIPMHGLPDLERAFTLLAARLGRPEVGAARAHAIDAAIEAARARGRGKGVRVLIVIDRENGGLGNMIAAAPGSWMDELIAIVGAQNVLAGATVRYPKISAEEILRGRPDVILDVSFAADPATAQATWGALPDVPAVAHGRVRVLKDAYFLGPSPRVAEALAGLEAALAPSP
jgi:iron complex transport system substrate-binding protein